MLSQISRLHSAVASYASPSVAPLVLLAGSSAMHQLVPDALIAFLREHPDVDVTVAEHRTPHIVALLGEGNADLGVVLTDEARGSGLETEPLGDDPLVVIGRPGGVLAGRTSMTYREVAEHPLVGLTAEAPLRRWIDKSVGPHGPAVRYRTQVANLTVVIALAAGGVGLAVVPRRALGPGGPLDVCELADPWSLRHHSLCRSASPRHGGRDDVAALAAHLRSAPQPAHPAQPRSAARPAHPARPSHAAQETGAAQTP